MVFRLAEQLRSDSMEGLMRTLVISIAILSAFTAVAFAHSGGTDASGCHLNHKTGVYHCH